MVVFVLMRIHEPVDVFAVPGVLVTWCWRDWFGSPCLPLVAEPCVEPWDVAAVDLAVVDGALVAAERGLEAGEFDGVSGDGRVQGSGFDFGLAAFRTDGSGIASAKWSKPDSGVAGCFGSPTGGVGEGISV